MFETTTQLKTCKPVKLMIYENRIMLFWTPLSIEQLPVFYREITHLHILPKYSPPPQKKHPPPQSSPWRYLWAPVQWQGGKQKCCDILPKTLAESPINIHPNLWGNEWFFVVKVQFKKLFEMCPDVSIHQKLKGTLPTDPYSKLLHLLDTQV